MRQGETYELLEAPDLLVDLRVFVEEEALVERVVYEQLQQPLLRLRVRLEAELRGDDVDLRLEVLEVLGLELLVLEEQLLAELGQDYLRVSAPRTFTSSSW